MKRFGNIDVDGVGTILFVRSKRAKHLNISIKPFTGVRVAVPAGRSLVQALQFVHKKSTWINKCRDRLKQYEREASRHSSYAIDRTEATIILQNRLAFLAQQYGFEYHQVSIRGQKTRWGSCSHRNNISLNMKLILLPPELMDYVILHELVHTRYKNHGMDFWKEMERLVTNSRGTAARLRQYSAVVL